MAAASITLSGTSIEVLTGDNYERWSILMENHLKGEGLWDGIIIGSRIDRENEDDRRRNAKALYAIQVSCAPHYLKKMRKIKSAGVAWSYLRMLAGSIAYGQRDVDPGIGNSELHRHVEAGDWNAVSDLIRGRCDAVLELNSSGRSVLHVAAIVGHGDIVEKLVDKDSRLLEITDIFGNTALALVARLNGNTKMAKCMVERNDRLLTMKTRDNEIPLLLASNGGHRELTRYLYSKTPHQVLTENNSYYGTKLLSSCIMTEIFDVALELLQVQGVPQISIARSYSDYKDSDIRPPLLALANMPHVFESGCQLNWWQPTIYQLIKELYDKKSAHHLVLQILFHLGKRILDFNEDELRVASAYDAMLQAAKCGIVEFIKSMGEANPHLLWTIDQNGRGIFSQAILNRQEKLFKYLRKRAEEQMRMISPRPDINGNNMLHHAAVLGPSTDVDSRFGAALLMQREIRWFEKVDKIVHPICKEARNANGRKPREVFTESHQELMEAGRKWANQTAHSFTIVCTLIITMTFTAVFTPPGGSNLDSGIPDFLKRKWFKVFIIADAASLITASSSVLLSIVILTSRYTQDDFVMILPIMLLAALFFLFMSVVAMLVAFCAVIAMMLNGYRSVVIAVILLASIPVIVFVVTQLPLFISIAKSTIRLKGFSTILWLPFNGLIYILIPFVTKFIYLIKKIKFLVVKRRDCAANGALDGTRDRCNI